MVRAGHLVLAAGYASQHWLAEAVARNRSSYALISDPLGEGELGFLQDTLLWETARPYFYLRTTRDGRLIAGGEDTSFSSDHRRDRLLAQKTQKIERRLRELFPNSELETACSWAGTFGESPDGLAVIGSPREMPYAYFALGFGGNGITFSMTAARIICDLYLGRPNRDAEIFSFSRVE